MIDRTEIEADQLTRLNRLLGELKSNRFYAPILRSAGIGGSVASLHEFREKTPFTTKEQIVADQAAHPPFGTNLTDPIERYTRFSSTSGTTANRLNWLDTPESWQSMLDNWKRVYEAAGVKRGDRAYFAFSFGPFLGFWTAFEAAAQIGLLSIPGGGLSSSARLRSILDHAVTILCCTPSYAIHLAETAARDGISLAQSRVRTIIVAGEPGGSVPAVRQRIEKLWPGARLFDHHGMTEVGPVSHECPARPGCLRIIESSYLAEVIDPSSLTLPLPLPGREGGVGELVLTTLGRYASPLLRYRTGDLVRPISLNESGDGPGPHLTLDGGILGRIDDMVVIRGVNIYPSAVEQLLRADPRIAEYRVEVDATGAMTQLSVRVEPTPNHAGNGTLRTDVEAAFRDAFSLRVPVELVGCGSLPRFEMKAQRWIRKDIAADQRG